MRTLNEAIDTIKQELTLKGNMYGKTYLKVAQAMSVPPQHSILVRMFEKMFRVKWMIDNGMKDSKAIASEFKEIAAYAILAMFESEVDDG